MKPGIIVLSDASSDVFRFMSNGWYDATRRSTPKAEARMVLAQQCIRSASDVPDAIEKLKAAGFHVMEKTDADAADLYDD